MHKHATRKLMLATADRQTWDYNIHTGFLEYQDHKQFEIIPLAHKFDRTGFDIEKLEQKIEQGEI